MPRRNKNAIYGTGNPRRQAKRLAGRRHKNGGRTQTDAPLTPLNGHPMKRFIH